MREGDKEKFIHAELQNNEQHYMSNWTLGQCGCTTGTQIWLFIIIKMVEKKKLFNTKRFIQNNSCIFSSKYINVKLRYENIPRIHWLKFSLAMAFILLDHELKKCTFYILSVAIKYLNGLE